MSFEIIQMTTEGWGAFFCIIAAIVVWQTRNTDRKRVFGLIRFILADCVLLISDSIAIGFRGHNGAEAFYIVRVSYVLVYIMGYFVIITGVAYFSTIRDCDEIIVMDHGRAVERGTHEELMKLDGMYKQLVMSE